MLNKLRAMRKEIIEIMGEIEKSNAYNLSTTQLARHHDITLDKLNGILIDVTGEIERLVMKEMGE